MDYYLFQLVEHPTRGNNILDLVMTNTPTFIQSDVLAGSQWSDNGLPSDHYPVIFDFAVDVCLMGNSGLQRFDFKKADFTPMKQALMLIPLSTGIVNISTLEDFDSLWYSWNDLVFAALVLEECVEVLAPSITAVINFSLREGVQLTSWKKASHANL